MPPVGGWQEMGHLSLNEHKSRSGRLGLTAGAGLVSEEIHWE
jgi:hypothetical protein